MSDTIHETWPPLVRIRRHWTDDWILLPYLRPIQTVLGQSPTIDSAAFQWDYGRLVRPGATTAADIEPMDGFLADWFVQILMPTGEPALVATDDTTETGEDEGGASGEGDKTAQQLGVLLWTGRFTGSTDAIGADAVVATGTGRETLTANGMGLLLRQSAVTGSQVLRNDSVVEIDTRLPFNLRSSSGVGLAGNRSTAKQTDPDGRGEAYVFSDDGEIWSAADVLEYLLVWYGPTEPAFALYGNAAATALGGIEDVWSCPRNVAAGLSAVVDRRRGLTWRIYLPDDVPTVVVRSILREAVTVNESITLPANGYQVTLNAADDAELTGVHITRSQGHQFDEIHVLGEPLWVAGAAAGLSAAWSTAEQSAYNSATDAARARDRERYTNVFQAFALDADNDEIFSDGNDGTLGCPTCTASGELDFQTPAKLFPFGRSLTRQTPFRDGYDYTGGEESARDADAPGEFLPPAVYISYTSGTTTVYQPVDALAERITGAPNIGVSLLDSALGLRLRCPWPHVFGSGTFSGTSAWPAPFAHSNLAATVAVRADERLKHVVTLAHSHRTGSPRRLVIEVPGAEAWVALKGSIVGIDADGYQRLGDHLILRNDAARLTGVAAMAKAWYGRERRALSLAWGRIETGYFPGDLITTLEAGGRSVECNSIVSRITWDWTRHRTHLTTDFGELDPVAATPVRPRGGAGRTPALALSPASPREPNLPVRQPAAAVADRIRAKITGAALVQGSTYRWAYSWAEIETTGTGADDYQLKTGGRTGAANAYNDAEAINDTVTGDDDRYTIGVSKAELEETGTFVIPRVPDDTPIWLNVEIAPATGDVRYSFSFPTNATGTCD